MLIAVIVVCEVMFWVVIVSGLAVRYLMSRPRAGGILLACAPLVDLVLLTASVLDLRAGGSADAAHTLAAIYIGVSLGFGHSMIQWADVRFAHRFSGGPAPVRQPRKGPGRAAHERRGVVRHMLAWGVGVGLMLLTVLVIDDSSRTEQLVGAAEGWTVILLIDVLISFRYASFVTKDGGTSGG